MVVLIQSELSASISEQSDDVKNLYEVRRGLRGGGKRRGGVKHVKRERREKRVNERDLAMFSSFFFFTHPSFFHHLPSSFFLLRSFYFLLLPHSSFFVLRSPVSRLPSSSLFP